MSAEERIKKIAEFWFLTEPAYFAVYCTHDLEPENRMRCPLRAGRGRLEYSPFLVEMIDDEMLEKLMRVEIIRILLKHPYERQPENCRAESVTSASDCVLTSYYEWPDTLMLDSPSLYDLPDMEAFEWYAHRLEEILPQEPQSGFDGQGDSSQSLEGQSISQQSSDGQTGSQQGGVEGQSISLQSSDSQTDSQHGDSSQQSEEDKNSRPQSGGSENQQQGTQSPQQSSQSPQRNQSSKADQSGLWEEDELMQERLNNTIEQITSWGSIPGKLTSKIVTSTQPKIDYRRAFAGFRASVLSSKRHLTRMRPNRRMDFEQMGSVYELTTRMLVAVDVSGSVSVHTLDIFYSLINRFFKYGIECIDVVQFDAALGEVQPLKKRTHEIQVLGGGGTSFQCVIDYAAQHPYDGLVILTDGYAPVPQLPLGFRIPLLWVLETEREYNEHKPWMQALSHSRLCWIRL